MSKRKEKAKAVRSAPLGERLATYSALASAAMLASPAADAAVQIWSVGQTLSGNPFYVAASFNATFGISFASTGHYGEGGDRYFWGPHSNLSFINNGGGANDPDRLGSGIAIGPIAPGTDAWFAAIASWAGSHDIQYAWSLGDQGYMGIRFSSGSQFYYGWVDMTTAMDGRVTVNRWALENVADTPVTIGAVPEPGTGSLLGLLALGAAGLRRRRAAVAAA